jgi:hypothetical protein
MGRQAPSMGTSSCALNTVRSFPIDPVKRAINTTEGPSMKVPSLLSSPLSYSAESCMTAC